MTDEDRVTIALAVVAPVKFTSTKDADILTVRVDPVGKDKEVDIPLNAESMESLDPILDAIAKEEYLSLEIVRYVL